MNDFENESARDSANDPLHDSVDDRENERLSDRADERFGSRANEYANDYANPGSRESSGDISSFGEEEQPRGWAQWGPRLWVIGGALILLTALVLTFFEPRLKEAGPFPPPVQTALEPPLNLLGPPGYKITAMDEYAIEAVVVSRERYYLGRESDLSPVDFLLAWGPLTLEPNLSGVSYSQSGRWGHWNYKEGAINISREDIELNASNHHIIPSETDPEIRRRLLKVRRGDVVRLKGYLVRVRGDDGWYWNTSRSRADSRGGACEIVYVTEMQ